MMKIETGTTPINIVNNVNSIDTVSNPVGVKKTPETVVTPLQNQLQGENQPLKNDEKANIEETLKIANEAFKEVNLGFRYSVDKKTNIEVIQVINTETNEQIKQFPPKEILNMMARIYDMLGILVDEKF